MKPFAIAGIQMPISAMTENVSGMISRIDVLMSLYPWVQMAVVSELAAYGPFLANALPIGSDVEKAFAACAKRNNIWLIPGSLFEKSPDGKIYNMSPVFNPQGEVVARYRKMFPFLPYEVDVESGSEFCVFDVPDVGRFGLSICYDMWFPETTRSLTALGAEVILHPTMTNSIDREVELSIARASAAMNQCFFFDINGAGEGGNGRSIIVGPAGDILYQAGHGEEMIPLEIDIDRVRRSREVGLRGLGQPIKSFRDRTVNFEVYDKTNTRFTEYPMTLGPLQKSGQGSRVGLREIPALSAPIDGKYDPALVAVASMPPK